MYYLINYSSSYLSMWFQRLCHHNDFNQRFSKLDLSFKEVRDYPCCGLEPLCVDF
jgi:hypothetical protein